PIPALPLFPYTTLFRALRRTTELENEAVRVRERAGAGGARRALEDDAQERVHARALQAHLVHEAVTDLRGLGAGGEADQPDPRFLRALPLDGVRAELGGLAGHAGA